MANLSPRPAKIKQHYPAEKMRLLESGLRGKRSDPSISANAPLEKEAVREERA